MKYGIYSGNTDIRLSRWLTVDVNSIVGLFRQMNVVATADASEIHLQGRSLTRAVVPLPLLAKRGINPSPPVAFETRAYIHRETRTLYTFRPWRWRLHVPPKRPQHRHIHPMKQPKNGINNNNHVKMFNRVASYPPSTREKNNFSPS